MMRIGIVVEVQLKAFSKWEVPDALRDIRALHESLGPRVLKNARGTKIDIM